jgi:hypothetical protein
VDSKSKSIIYSAVKVMETEAHHLQKNYYDAVLRPHAVLCLKLFVFLFVVNITTLSVTQAIEGRMIGR